MDTPSRLVNIKKSRSAERVVYTAYRSNKYCALSHVWGKHDDACHAGVQWKISAFSFNNFMALLSILVGKLTNLWVDSYCIRQDDPRDKGLELPRMKHYYSNASCVIILPNGVDGLFSNSVIFNNGHWCKWTQRVWTAPEVSLADQTMVMCCLDVQQAAKVRSITSKDLDKQLFPVSIKGSYTANQNEIIMVSIEDYCEIVTLKASGYLDHTSDTNDGDFDYPPGVENTMRTISNVNEKSINTWVHRTFARECCKSADRIYSMLPVLKTNVSFVDSEYTLEEAISGVLQHADKPTIFELALSTSGGNSRGYSFFPKLAMCGANYEQLVYIKHAVEADSCVNVNYQPSIGLLLENVNVVTSVEIAKYVYQHRDGPEDIDNAFGNTGYTIGDRNVPCCVGKCNTSQKVDLIELGTTKASEGDKYRMLETFAENSEYTCNNIFDTNVSVVCCIACVNNAKAGVLLVIQKVFLQLSANRIKKIKIT